MIQKTKIFYGSLAVLAFIALVLGACPDKSADSVEPVYDPSLLKLSGQVYNYDQNNYLSSLLRGPKEFKGKLSIYDGGLGGLGLIKNGLLNYYIKKPPLSPINEDGGLDYLKGMYPSLEFSSEDVKAAVVALEISNSSEYSGLLKSLIGPTPPKPAINLLTNKVSITINIETVNYVYVDKNLNIKADAGSTDVGSFGFDFGFPITLTADKINLNLKKGWNSLYSKITAKVTMPLEMLSALMAIISSPNPDLSTLDLKALETSGNLKMSVADPETLKWTLVPSPSSVY